MITTAIGTIQPHNERPAAVWSSGGSNYDQISRGIADSIEHCVMRLNPQPDDSTLGEIYGAQYFIMSEDPEG